MFQPKRNHLKARRATAVCLTGLLFFSITAAALGQVTTGTISGRVTDSGGGVLKDASVVVENEDTGITRTGKTDAAGQYAAPLLTLGRYRVSASLQGFQAEARSGIVLTVGREAIVNLQLQVGAFSQTLEVSGEAPLVEATSAAVSYPVGDSTIRNLPLNGRDLTQLILLEPGIAVSENGDTSSSFSGFGKRVSVSGLRGEDNAYYLDGSYINEYHRHLPAGPSGALLGAETIQEFQVLTNSFDAQYGRAIGGVFNAVSKSGTNEWHGDVYEFVRNSAMDAANWEDNAFNQGVKPPFVRNQFGATAGGPIKKNETFFFLAYEGTQETLSNTRVAIVPDQNARQGILPLTPAGCNAANGTVQRDGTCLVPVSAKMAPYLPFFPLPSPQGRNFGDGTAQYIFAADQPTDEHFGLARLDHQISVNDSLFARFTGSSSTRTQVLGYPAFSEILSLGTRLLTVSETHIFSPHALNTFRASFNRVFPADQGVYPEFPANLLSVPGQPAPGLNPGGNVTGFEGFVRPIDYFITNRFSYQDDMNWSLGGHALQFGGMAERLQLNMNQPDRPYGEWNFSSLQNFLAATPSTFRGTPPTQWDPVRGARQWFFGLYLQDTWRLTSRLVLNLGVRWEPYTVPTEVNGLIANLRHVTDPETTLGGPLWLNHSMKDVEPRFGFAWSPFGSAKTSVRGGFGVFFVPLDPFVYYLELTRVPPLYPSFNFADTGHFPDALAEIAAAQLTTFGTTDAFPFDNFKSSKALQYHISVQRQVGASSLFAVGYTGSRGINLTSKEDLNQATAVFDGISLAFPAGATVVNPNFNGIICFCSDANSWYNGLTASWQRRLSAGLQAQISYTFSKDLDDDPGQDLQDTSKYPRERAANKGYSVYDIRNTLKINYSYDLPFAKSATGLAGRLLGGWQLTGVATAQSGQPFSVSIGIPAALASLQLANRTPNLVPEHPYDSIIKGGPNQYFDPSAFSPPSASELGNVARDSLTGPGLVKWDLGLTRNAALTDRCHLELRAEIFNLLNRTNFSLPASSVFSGSGSPVLSAGSISSTLATAKSRQVQLGMKLVF